MNQLTKIDAASYEKDFVLWIEHQLALLKAKKFDSVDFENVIEEFDSMSRRERHELASRIENVLLHLLKCQFQPEYRSGSWLATLREQRSQIIRQIKSSPSLNNLVATYADNAYAAAVDRAVAETGLPISHFPAVNPYASDALLDPAFVP